MWLVYFRGHSSNQLDRLIKKILQLHKKKRSMQTKILLSRFLSSFQWKFEFLRDIVCYVVRWMNVRLKNNKFCAFWQVSTFRFLSIEKKIKRQTIYGFFDSKNPPSEGERERRKMSVWIPWISLFCFDQHQLYETV